MCGLSGATRILRQSRAYLARDTPSLLNPLFGLGFLLFYLEPQKLILLSSFFIITVKNILDLGAMLFKNSIRNQRSTIEPLTENSPYRSSRSSFGSHVPCSLLHESHSSLPPGSCRVQRECAFGRLG